MTFEARDSAAKVVPARFKFNNTIKASPVSKKQLSERSDSRRSTSCQTKWDNHMGLYGASSNKTGSGRDDTGGASPCGSEVMNRRALTAAFVQFSRALQNRQPSTDSGSPRLCNQPVTNAITRSPSAPNLFVDNSLNSDNQNQIPIKPQIINPSPKSRPKISDNSLRPTGGGCALLSPYLLQRQALSMDNPAYGCYSPPPLLRRQPSGRSTRSGGNMSAGSRESLELGASAGANCSHHGSQASMVMDLHFPNDCPVTLKVKDQSRKSETAKRHLFVRQKPVEEDFNEFLPTSGTEFRRESHSCSPRIGRIYVRTNTEDVRTPHQRSRANTAESKYHRQPRSRRSSVSYSRSSTDEAKLQHSRSRSSTGESTKSHKRRESSAVHHRHLYTRSNTEDSRSRRSSTCDYSSRRCRESKPAPFFTRSNTASTEEYKRLHYRRRSPTASPYSITRSNTEESSAPPQREDISQDIEMAIVGAKPNEDSSLHELLRSNDLERQNQQKRNENNDERSENNMKRIKTQQSSSVGNSAVLSDAATCASDLDFVIEIDNGQTAHI